MSEVRAPPPLLTRDIELMGNGRMAVWGNHVDEIIVHIDGSTTDWMNQGCSRSHAITPIGSNNSDLCVVRALIDLYEAYPIKFPIETENIYWPHGAMVML